VPVVIGRVSGNSFILRLLVEVALYVHFRWDRVCTAIII